MGIIIPNIVVPRDVNLVKAEKDYKTKYWDFAHEITACKKLYHDLKNN